MGKTDDSKKSIKKLADMIISHVLLILSYVLLFAFEWKLDVRGIILLFISAVFFCIGFFRTLALIPANSEKSVHIATIVILILAALLTVIGYLYLFFRWDEKGISIAVLFMIQSLALCIAYIDWDDIKQANRAIITCRILTVLFIAGAVVINIIERLSERSLAIGTLLIVECIALFAVSRKALRKPGDKADS